MGIPRYPVIILGGQSNMQGSTPQTTGPEGGRDFQAGTMTPDASIRFFASDNFGEHTAPAALGMVPWGSTLDSGTLVPHHGPEQKLGADLKAAGWTNITILKWTHNGTIISHFCPGGVAGNAANTPGVDWYRLHRVIHGGRPKASGITPFFIWMQGESDAVATDSSQAQADAWGTNFSGLFSAVQSAVGTTLIGGKMIGRININIYNTTDGDNSTGQTATAPWVANVRACQAAQAAKLFDLDSKARYSQDHLHFTSAGQHSFGADIAAHLLTLV